MSASEGCTKSDRLLNKLTILCGGSRANDIIIRNQLRIQFQQIEDIPVQSEEEAREWAAAVGGGEIGERIAPTGAKDQQKIIFRYRDGPPRLSAEHLPQAPPLSPARHNLPKPRTVDMLNNNKTLPWLPVHVRPPGYTARLAAQEKRWTAALNPEMFPSKSLTLRPGATAGASKSTSSSAETTSLPGSALPKDIRQRRRSLSSSSSSSSARTAIEDRDSKPESAKRSFLLSNIISVVNTSINPRPERDYGPFFAPRNTIADLQRWARGEAQSRRPHVQHQLRAVDIVRQRIENDLQDAMVSNILDKDPRFNLKVDAMHRYYGDITGWGQARAKAEDHKALLMANMAMIRPPVAVVAAIVADEDGDQVADEVADEVAVESFDAAEDRGCGIKRGDAESPSKEQHRDRNVFRSGLSLLFHPEKQQDTPDAVHVADDCGLL